MRQLLRFLLFDRPDRQSSTQIHIDIEVNDPPRFMYGETVNVGSDDVSPLDWPAYVVADLVHGRQVDDVNEPGRKLLVFEVFLAREEEWPQFKLPEHVRRMMEGRQD